MNEKLIAMEELRFIKINESLILQQKWVKVGQRSSGVWYQTDFYKWQDVPVLEEVK